MQSTSQEKDRHRREQERSGLHSLRWINGKQRELELLEINARGRGRLKEGWEETLVLRQTSSHSSSIIFLWLDKQTTGFGGMTVSSPGCSLASPTSLAQSHTPSNAWHGKTFSSLQLLRSVVLRWLWRRPSWPTPLMPAAMCSRQATTRPPHQGFAPASTSGILTIRLKGGQAFALKPNASTAHAFFDERGEPEKREMMEANRQSAQSCQTAAWHPSGEV